MTLAGALLPQWWGSRTTSPQPTPQATSDSAPITKFEFFDRLPNERISARSIADESPKPLAADGAPREFLLQAGSFTNKEDADRLRDTLVRSAFEAETARVQLSGGAVRYRVVVGPFSTSRDTQQAIAQLRKQDVDALVLARKPGAG